MAIEQVREYVKQFGMEGRIREFDVSSATVELAAQALGTAPERIAKTLAFQDGEGCILVVAAGDAKVDNRKFKEQFGMKPRMLPFDDVERLVGHAVGGVCPFGIRPGIPVYVDKSVERFESVYPACGSSNSAIELKMDELMRCSNAVGMVDVCKGWADASE